MDNVLPPDYELFNGNIVRHYQSTIADGFRTAGLVGEYDQLNRLRFGTNTFYGSPATAAGRSLTEALEAPTYDGNGNIRTLDRSYTGTTEQRHRNRLAYTYAPGTNRLERVDADVHGAAINEDWLPFDLLQGRTAYRYDGSGNLVEEKSDRQAGATTINWNPYGKVTTVTSPTGTTTFGYGPDQNRWVKDRGERGATYYVRDAQGSTLATYEGGRAGAELTWKQQYLFGSSRLGEVVFDRPIEPTTANPFNYGERRYELTNHLGNVTTVFRENAVVYTDTEDGTTYTAPALVSYRDYMAFGLGLDRGAGVLGKGSYRFAFNGKEVDNDQEWGQGTTNYDYGFRIYNPGMARFLSVDPLYHKMPEWSPYSTSFNNPILYYDPDGRMPQKWPPDWWVDNKVGTRLVGALKVIGGAGEVVVGAIGVAAPEPVTSIAGGAAVLHGSDVTTSGFIQLWTGDANETMTSRGLQATGASKETAEMIDGGISVGLTGGLSYTATARAAVPSAKIPALPFTPRRIGGSSDDWLALSEQADDGFRVAAESATAATRSIKNVQISPEGISSIRQHLSNAYFTATTGGKMAKGNEVMINRLQNIADGKLSATATDLYFYTHEILEQSLMKGVYDDVSYMSSHARAAKEYGVKAVDEVSTFYTDEAQAVLFQ